MTRKIIVDRFGDPETLSLSSVDMPEPGPGEVLVAVQYAGVAFSDLLMREGLYPGGPQPPYTPGWDVVGKVVAIGESVDPELMGRAVAGLAFLGGYADHALVKATHVVELPADVDRRAAACLVLNYVTALQMFVRVARATKGDTVLVRGAAGGVGTAALDIARAFGLVARGVCSPAKAETVERFGATWMAAGDEAREATASGGFDIVLDPAGGAKTWRSMRLLAPGGRVVTYGFTGLKGGRLKSRLIVHTAAMALRSLGPGGKRASFYRVSQSARRRPSDYRHDLKLLLDLLADGRLTPLVADVLPLSQAAEAHRRINDRIVEGKLLLSPHGN